MVNGKELIGRQLKATKITEVAFADGKKTVLTPARFVPQLADEKMRLSLNGSWRILKWPFENEEAALAGKNLDDSSWQTVQQPGKVFYYDPEEKPEEVEDYNRVTLAHINPDDGAVLRRKISIPANWSGKRIYLRFDAIYPASRIYCNGELLGEHLSGLTPVEFDVTDLVKPGEEATVAARLIRRHKYVQMDMPRHACEFAGISQDGYFHATGCVQISDYHLISELDESLARGMLEGEVLVRSHSASSCNCKLDVSVTNPRDGSVTSAKGKVKLPAGEERGIAVKLTIDAVQLWNDEVPNLYEVEIRLEAEGQQPQVVSYRTGFRRLEFANQRPMLNGKPVKFRGVNHLTFHPEGGMFTPKEWLRKSLTLMKRANVNAVRTHFLGPRALADICDELGIYLIQELPIDWGTEYIHDPEWLGPALFRMEGGLRRDRHHPSVMVWGIGNENMPNKKERYEDGFNHLRIFEKFAKTLDPTRPTMFPPPGPANKIEGILELRVGDIADIHYSFNLIREFNKTGKATNPRTWEADMETITREQALARGWSGVWFSSEYGICNLIPDVLNAPYVSIIADRKEDLLSGKNTLQVFIDRLKEEWGYMRDDPTCLGGAYFPWLCAGAGNNPWGWVRWGEDADWGVVTADLLPKPAFWALRVLFSPVQFPEKLSWEEGQKELAFEVTNGYNSIDLSECTLRTMMGGGGEFMGIMGRWRDVPISGAPGEVATVRIPIWNPGSMEALERGAAIVCRCILLDPDGFRPITADILVVPKEKGEVKSAMPIGPDAE